MEKGEKQERRRYTQEFKLEAIRLVRTGIAKARVARDLGIHLSVLKDRGPTRGVPLLTREP
jgi:transposase-like protein